MKKVQIKRAGVGFAKPNDLIKPYNFCCDVNHQDPDTRYDMRIPPFVTSLTNVAPNSKEGPDLKFRLQQDIGKQTFPTQHNGTYKVKNSTQMCRGKRGRGPLLWYIEDEIALARVIILSEREERCKREKKIHDDLLRAKKMKKRRRSKKRKSSKEAIGETDDKQKDADKEEG